MKLNEMMNLLEPYGSKTRQHLTAYCRDGVIPAERSGNNWYPDDKYVNRGVMWRKGQTTLEELIAEDSYYAGLSDADKKKCRRSIKRYATIHFQEENCYSVLFNDHFVNKEEIESVKRIIAKESAYYANRNTLVPIKEAAESMGVSVYQAKKMPLPSKRLQGNLYCDNSVIDQMNESRSKYIGIYTLATKIVPTIRTAFDLQSETDRFMLRKYIRESELRDVVIPAETMPFPDDRKNAFYIPKGYEEAVSCALITFFRRYGLVSERLAILSADPYWETHPITKKLLDRFKNSKQDNGIAALMETLIYGLHCEITDCTNEDIEGLLAYAESAKYQIYKQYVVLFVNYCKKKADKCVYSIILKFDSMETRQNVVDTSPYPFPQYMAFSCFLFAQPMIESNDLVGKAFSEIRYALLWLYCIWQYVTAWRIGDFFNIPILRIPYTKEQLRTAVERGCFEQEAITLSFLLENEINSRQIRPKKTAEKQDEAGSKSQLVVVFPESMRVVIGMVYAICVVMSDFCSFPVIRFSVNDFEYMFGPKYKKILGNTVFQNRRANKAFLGTVVELAERDPAIRAPMKGYALASYQRAHAVNLDSLSDMTSRYLQYKLEGLTMDEILMQLWDTGCCSFVPYMLLQAVYGEKFRTLSVSDQTNILLESRLTAFTAEAGAQLIRKAYLHDRDVVQTILSAGGKNAARQVLQGLLDREASSKQLGVMCQLSPLKLPCSHKRAKRCIACAYKITQVSAIYLIMSDIEEMIKKMNSAMTEGSRRKYFLALRDYYFPAAYQILVFSKETYGINVSDIGNQLADMYEKGGLQYDLDQGKII